PGHRLRRGEGAAAHQPGHRGTGRFPRAEDAVDRSAEGSGGSREAARRPRAVGHAVHRGTRRPGAGHLRGDRARAAPCKGPGLLARPEGRQRRARRRRRPCQRSHPAPRPPARFARSPGAHLRRHPVKKHLLATAIMASLAPPPRGAPRRPQPRPRTEPLARLQPVAEAENAYELLIYGDIGESWWGESVTAQSIAKQLNELSASVATINVRINSYGGSVADGLAIYNALKRHKATKAVTVDGVAMSSASLIAMAGDTVSMPPTSILMIHAPWGGCYGNAKEMRQYADVLDTFSESMADA